MITRATLKVLREDINQALASVGKKHNLKLEAGHISFTESHLTLKVEGTVVGAKSRDAELYERSAALNKLPPLDTEITLQGKVFIVRGMKSRGRNCVMIDRKSDGKGYVCDIDTILRAVPKAPTMTLTEFVAEANRLDREHVAKLNADPKNIFGAEHHDLPEAIFTFYHQQGMTPQQALDAIKEEAAAEMRFEAKAS